MADINQSNWSETDSSNNAASPNGWTSGSMLPSQIEPTARAVMGAMKRLHNQISPTVTSGGTSNAQTLTHTVGHTALVTGDVFSFIAGATNTGDTTVNVDGLGALHIKRNGANLVGGEIQSGGVVKVAYDGSNMQLMSTSNSALFTTVTNSINGNIGLSNTSTYFDGPSISQGTIGTWFVTGTVTVTDTTSASNFTAKLWDGTTVIASTSVNIAAPGAEAIIPLSGVISAPAGNLKISVKDVTSTNGLIQSNNSGNSKDSTITAVRIA